MANHPTLATAGIRACWSNPMTAGAEQNSAGPTPTQQLEPREGQAKFDARRTHSVAISSDKPCAHVTTTVARDRGGHVPVAREKREIPCRSRVQARWAATWDRQRQDIK